MAAGVASGPATRETPAGAAPAEAGAAEDGAVPERARKAAGIAGTLTWLGGFLLVLSAVLRGASVHRWPLGNMFEFAVVGAMFTVLAFCVWSTRRDLRWLGLFVIAPVLLTLGLAITVWYTEAAELLPSLKSVWLAIHVTVATLSVGLFAIAASATAIYLVKDALQRSGRRSILDRFPAAPAIERLAYSLHIVAFPLWTFTLIAGAIWARQAWGAYWNWDPKEVWTFVIWVVYAAYLHARHQRLEPAVGELHRPRRVGLHHHQLHGGERVLRQPALLLGALSRMVRYTVLRLLIFFGVLAALWLLGLRDRDEQLLLLVLSAVISMAISLVVLKRFRDDYSEQIAERLQRRAEAKQQRARRSDEQAEDAEDDGGRGHPRHRGDQQGPVEYR